MREVKCSMIMHPIVRFVFLKAESLNIFEEFKEIPKPCFPFTMCKEFLLKSMGFYIKINGK